MQNNIWYFYLSLRNHCSNSLEVVFEVRRNFSCLSIVPCDSVDSWLFNCEPILSVLIVSILFQMLSDWESFFDQMVKILRDFSCQSFFFQNSLDFLSRKKSDLGDSIWVSKDYTNLWFSKSLFGVFDNQILNIFGRCFKIWWVLSRVR